MLLVFYDMITIRKQRGLLKQFAKNSLTWLQPIFPLSPTFSTGQANVEPAFLGAEEDLRRGLLRGGHDIGGEVFAPGESAQATPFPTH